MRRRDFADQDRGEMRQRRQISARADRTLFRYHGVDTSVEQFAQELDHFQPDPAQAEREHIGSQQYHRPHFRERIQPCDHVFDGHAVIELPVQFLTQMTRQPRNLASAGSGRRDEGIHNRDIHLPFW